MALNIAPVRKRICAACRGDFELLKRRVVLCLEFDGQKKRGVFVQEVGSRGRYLTAPPPRFLCVSFFPLSFAGQCKCQTVGSHVWTITAQVRSSWSACWYLPKVFSKWKSAI
ncbi:hypothetical protein BaRGS_00007747 [Batillaria attramentaria]|uniref:Uncharacterized protein n=1 Tax=Batillaria attramentaria TaxID=370345 RepID=A0ABD0LMR0_9CAEN